MELYYKDLISEDSSLEKLVDDLMLVVQGAEEFAEANGTKLQESQTRELTSRLQQLKAGCRRLREHAVQSAVAADKVMHRYPYSVAGAAFVCGLLAARFWPRRR